MSINNSVLRKDINELMDKLDYNDLVELKNYIERLNYDKELQKTYNYYFLTEGCIYDRGISEEYIENHHIDIARFLNNMYYEATKDCNKLSLVARNHFRRNEWKVDEETYNRIDKENRFQCEICIDPVISVEDKDIIEKMLLDNEPIDRIKEYILNSKASQYVSIDCVDFNFIYDEVQIPHLKGVFNYNLMRDELDRLGYNIVLKDYITGAHLPNNYETILDRGFNKEDSIFGLLSPKGFEVDNEDYIIFNKNKALQLTKND